MPTDPQSRRRRALLISALALAAVGAANARSAASERDRDAARRGIVLIELEAGSLLRVRLGALRY